MYLRFCLVQCVKSPIFNKSKQVQLMAWNLNRQWGITWTNVDPVHWHVCVILPQRLGLQLRRFIWSCVISSSEAHDLIWSFHYPWPFLTEWYCRCTSYFPSACLSVLQLHPRSTVHIMSYARFIFGTSIDPVWSILFMAVDIFNP